MTESKSKGTVDNGEGSVTGPDPRVAPATSEEGEKSRQVAVLGDKENTKKGLKECPSINQSIKSISWCLCQVHLRLWSGDTCNVR